MGFSYLQRRSELVANTLRMGQALGLKEEVVHDAVLLMDRTMSTSLQVSSRQTCSLGFPVHSPSVVGGRGPG